MEGMNFISLFLQTTAAFMYCYWLWTRRHLYAFCLRTPGLWGLPFIGQFYKMQSPDKTLPVIREAFEVVKRDTIFLWLGAKLVLFTKEPAFIEKLLTSQDGKDMPTIMNKVGAKMLGDSFINRNGLKWQQNRRLIAPFFQKQNMLKLFPIFNEAKNTLIEKFEALDANVEHEVLEIIKETLFGTAMATFLNQHPKEHLTELRNYIENSNRCKSHIQWHVVLNYLKLAPLYCWNGKALKSTKRFISKPVKQSLDNYSKGTNQELNNTNKIPGNFLDFCLNLYKNQKLSKKEVIAETHTLYEGSAETSHVAVFSTLVLLAMHPNVQAQLFEELKKVLPESPSEIQYEQLQELPYLNMVISESLRVIPPIVAIPRTILKDTKLSDDWLLPKGLDVYVSLFDLHYNKDIWGPDADKFEPNRFLPENISKLPPSSYLPFSKGPRNCAGLQYALFSLKVAIAGLVRHFEFRTSSKFKNLRFSFKVGTEFLEEPKLQIVARKA